MDSKNNITLGSLEGKTSGEIRLLLKNKYPNPPRYIKPSQFDSASRVPYEAIDTVNWRYVRPDNENTAWIDSGQGGILTNDELIVELLNNTEQLEEATLPKNGGRRRAQRKTKVKSKKRANKRRTRSRK
jgi:hypothetical protein